MANQFMPQKNPKYPYGIQAMFPSDAGASMPPWLRMATGHSPLPDDVALSAALQSPPAPTAQPSPPAGMSPDQASFQVAANMQRQPEPYGAPDNRMSGQGYPSQQDHSFLPPQVQGALDRAKDAVAGHINRAKDQVLDRIKGDLIGAGMNLVTTIQPVDDLIIKAQGPDAADVQHAPQEAPAAVVQADDLQPLLNQLSQGEGTSDEKAREHGFASGYDVPLGYGEYGKSATPLSQLTLDQVDALQTQILRNPNNHLNSSAVGRFQIVRKTLRGLRRNMGLRGDEKFDEAMQERLARQLLHDAHLNDYRAGKISFHQFQHNLRNLWASVANEDTGVTPRGGTTTEQLRTVATPLTTQQPQAAQRRNK